MILNRLKMVVTNYLLSGMIFQVGSKGLMVFTYFLLVNLVFGIGFGQGSLRKHFTDFPTDKKHMGVDPKIGGKPENGW